MVHKKETGLVYKGKFVCFIPRDPVAFGVSLNTPFVCGVVLDVNEAYGKPNAPSWQFSIQVWSSSASAGNKNELNLFTPRIPKYHSDFIKKHSRLPTVDELASMTSEWVAENRHRLPKYASAESCAWTWSPANEGLMKVEGEMRVNGTSRVKKTMSEKLLLTLLGKKITSGGLKGKTVRTTCSGEEIQRLIDGVKPMVGSGVVEVPPEEPSKRQHGSDSESSGGDVSASDNEKGGNENDGAVVNMDEDSDEEGMGLEEPVVDRDVATMGNVFGVRVKRGKVGTEGGDDLLVVEAGGEEYPEDLLDDDKKAASDEEDCV